MDPDIAAEQRYLHLSSLLLGQPVTGARGRSRRRGAQPAPGGPLITLAPSGRKLVSSITKVFKGQDLCVFFEGCDAAAESRKLAGIAASLRFLPRQEEGFPIGAAEGVRAGRAWQHGRRLDFQIPLAKLAPGHYIYQVSAIAEFWKKSALRRSPPGTRGAKSRLARFTKENRATP